MMLRERPSTPWIALAVLAALTVGLWPSTSAPPPPPPPPVKVRCERLVVEPPDPDAELRKQYLAARAVAFDPAASPIDAFEALRRARTLDIVLGGAARDELTFRMRQVAPVAVRAYEDTGDKAGAQLAAHTAAMVGPPR